MQNIGAITVVHVMAEEVAMEKLSLLTIASSNIELTNIMHKLLTCRYIKVNIKTDLIGIEYTAVLKNIYAVAQAFAMD